MSPLPAPRRVHLFEGPRLLASLTVEHDRPAASYVVNGVEYRTESAIRVLHHDGTTGYDISVIATGRR